MMHVEQMIQHRPTNRPLLVARIALATLGMSALAALLFAPDTSGAASPHSVKSIVISTAHNAKLGTILVSGNTLYTLKPSHTSCGVKCLKYWPEVLLPKGATKPTAGPGVNASKLGTMKRTGGALQVTYAGQALYWFSKDTAAGQVRGNVTDVWGKWFAVVTKKASSGSGVTTTTKPGSGTTTTTKPGSGATTTTTIKTGGGATTTTTSTVSGTTTTTIKPGGGTTTTTIPVGGGIGF